MSCRLYWRPLKVGRDVGTFQLRDAIEKRCGLPCTVGTELVAYLEGLVDGDIPGAQDLIDVIEQHGTIELYKEC